MYQTRNAVIGNLPTALRSLVLSVMLILSAFLPSFPSQAAPVIVRQDSIQYVLNMATHTAKVDGYMVGITNAVIPDTITYEKNRFPVTRIGNYVFRGCGTLRSISLPETLDTIGEESFKQCSGLTSIVIPNSVKILGPHAFMQCGNLSSVILGQSLKAICYGAFYYCETLKHIDLPNSVNHLGNFAFKASGLETIKLSESLTSLNSQLFQSTPLKKLVIPASVTSVIPSAFLKCKQLQSIEVAEGNQSYHSQDGVLYDNNGYLVIYPSAKPGNTYQVPEQTTGIGTSAFLYNRFLKHIQLPKSLVAIEKTAFAYCDSLVSVNLPGAVLKINGNPFRGSKLLEEINVAPGNVNYTEKDGIVYSKDFSTLYICPPSKKEIVNLVIPEGVKTISEYAFDSQKTLANLTMPSTVTTIQDYAFNNCNKLHVIEFGSQLANISTCAFNKNTSLESIVIPNSVNEIGSNAFSDCTSLKKVTLGKSINKYGTCILAGCNAIEGIYVSATTPFKFGNTSSYPFNYTNYNNATLYVPEGTTASYKSVKPWSNFQNIKEWDPNKGIGEISDGAHPQIFVENGRIVVLGTENIVNVFDLSGRLMFSGNGNDIPSLGKGIYIVTYGNERYKVII